MSRSAKAFALALLLLAPACIHRPTPNPNILVVGVTSGPNNLDPRIGTVTVSAKSAQLVFNNLRTLDDHLSAAGRRHDGLVLRIVPYYIMRGLELRKGTMDIVVNDLAPDIVHQLAARSGAAAGVARHRLSGTWG